MELANFSAVRKRPGKTECIPERSITLSLVPAFAIPIPRLDSFYA